MDIADWRKKIDEIDRKLVELLNQRAAAAQEIGRLKRNTNLPIYEPDRERNVFVQVQRENQGPLSDRDLAQIYEPDRERNVFVQVQRENQGPLSDRDLAQIYERIMDVMRKIQKEEIAPQVKSAAADTELDSEVND